MTRKTAFRLDAWQMFGEAPAWQQRIELGCRAFLRTNFPAAIGLLFACVAIAAAWKIVAPKFEPELWPAMGGMAFEVFFILIVFAAFEQRRNRFQEIERQQEVIDDFKRWDAPEARLRMAGAIRRLNRMNVFSVRLSGIELSDFSFAKEGIRSLSRSIFYDGTWGVPHNETAVKLSRVRFDHVDCSDVEFSPFDPLEALFPSAQRYARFIDCSFVEASLQRAVFNGAELRWSDTPPSSHYELVDEDEDGRPSYAQSSQGPFHDVDLATTSFRGCVFRNADFRDAVNVSQADFFRATGLESAVFDDDTSKDLALVSAKRPSEAVG